MKSRHYRYRARVLFHLDGYTQVATDLGISANIAIPTSAIPDPLRKIGSEFIVSVARPEFEENDEQISEELLRDFARITIHPIENQSD